MKRIPFLAMFIGLSFAQIISAQAMGSFHNVLVYFPNQNSPVLQSYISELDREKSQFGMNSIKSYSLSREEDGGVIICIDAVNAGNQYRVIEYTKNSTNLVPGASVKMSSAPCK